MRTIEKSYTKWIFEKIVYFSAISTLVKTANDLVYERYGHETLQQDLATT